MQIICPIHAKERMEQRNITQKQIEKAIKDPDVRMPTRHKQRKRIMKKFSPKTLDVIYEPRGKDKIVLITAMWLREEDREVKG